MARLTWFALLLCFACWAVGGSTAAEHCATVQTPGSIESNTKRIQGALDAAPGTASERGCVSVGPGDWYVRPF